MKTKEFFGKFLSGYLWGNLLAMTVVVALLCLGVKFGLELYTHHGQGIPVPNFCGMNIMEVQRLADQNGLQVVVNDSGYNRRMPADCVLAQNPARGIMVKEGHVIYLTVNSPSSPSFAIPDIIDNSSVREATAKLTAMGFKLLEPKLVMGEKDWVYGIISRGRRLSTGDRVPIDVPLTLMIGNGKYDEGSADIDYTEPEYAPHDDVDDFEEVTEPPQENETTPPSTKTKTEVQHENL